jgi:hypothetical protein
MVLVQVTLTEILWLLFQAVIASISVIALDWDARNEDFGAGIRLTLVVILAVLTFFFGIAGPVIVLSLYYVVTRHFLTTARR